jgi:hypothetical protein
MSGFKRTQLLFVFSILLFSQTIAFGDNSVLSTAHGLGGVNWIANDKDLRGKIEVSDEQLAEIRKFLSDKKVFVGDETKDNETGTSFLNKVLTKNQAKLLRIEVVRTRIGTPANLFSPIFLSELVESADAQRIYGEFAQRQKIIAERIDKLRIQAIKTALPPSAQGALWKFIGNEFSIEETDGDLEHISQWLPPVLQIQQAPYVAISAEKLRLPVEKREELRIVADEIRRKKAHGISCTRDELEQHLDSILSKSQRFVVVQSLNQEIVRSDLLMVVAPNMVKQYDLSDDGIAEARAELVEFKEIIAEYEMAQVIQACGEVLRLKVVPAHVKKEIMGLVPELIVGL